MKLIIILMILITLSGCQNLQELSKPKPVEIDGLGSLQSLKDTQLDENQLRTLFDGLNKQKLINETDAEALLNIYKINSKNFIKFSGRTSESEKVVNFLSLILQNEKLREDTRFITDQAMAENIHQSADFNDGSISGISDLSANYLAAALKTIAKEDSQLRTGLIKKQQTVNSTITVQGFEAKAMEIITNKELKPEQKQNAEKFLANLKTYNDSLPADAKILDTTGRLINPSQMSGTQRQSLEDIFSGDENLSRRGLAERMDATRDKLNNRTEQKLH